jgi:hypothetical protein
MRHDTSISNAVKLKVSCICPPGARAKMHMLFLRRPLAALNLNVAALEGCWPHTIRQSESWEQYLSFN